MFYKCCINVIIFLNIFSNSRVQLNCYCYTATYIVYSWCCFHKWASSKTRDTNVDT